MNNGLNHLKDDIRTMIRLSKEIGSLGERVLQREASSRDSDLEYAEVLQNEATDRLIKLHELREKWGV